MIYWTSWLICNVLFKVLGRRRLAGLKHLPRRGAVILAVNHISALDPPAVGCVVPRRLHFMAKEELFRPAAANWFLRKLNAFPVRRGAGDRTALKRSLELLAAGEALLIFPEGTRSETGELKQAELGIGMLALRSGAPVVPVRISGSNGMLPSGAKLPRFGRLRIAFGEPLRFAPAGEKPGREDYQAVAERVTAALAALESTG